MRNAGDLRKGMVILYQGAIHVVLEYQHIKPGKGPAYMQVTLRNMKTGNSVQVRFRSAELVENVTLENKRMQFLYRDVHGYHFMDLEDYNTILFPESIFGVAHRYLKEGDEVDVQFYKAEPIKLELPTTVSLKVQKTIPGFKGDSVTNLQKPATLETGYELSVPLFIREGDTVKVDTRTGEYLGRA
jgi:elongation factor P